MVLAQFGTGQVLWSMVWFTVFFIWIWLLILVFSDIFRSRDLSGGPKTLWMLLVIVLPYLGVFLYLIIRGHKMGEHAAAAAKDADERQRAYIQSVVSTAPTPADELTKVADLRDKGVIDDTEFQAMKNKILATNA